MKLRPEPTDRRICKQCGMYVAIKADGGPHKHGRSKWRPEGCPGAPVPSSNGEPK